GLSPDVARGHVSPPGWMGPGVRAESVTIDSQASGWDTASLPARPSLSVVARVPRCALPDGSFHVGARGVAQMPIYLDDADRLVFLRLLVVAIARFDWTCHAFCLMTNHYHLVLDATREEVGRAPDPERLLRAGLQREVQTLGARLRR